MQPFPIQTAKLSCMKFSASEPGKGGSFGGLISERGLLDSNHGRQIWRLRLTENTARNSLAQQNHYPHPIVCFRMPYLRFIIAQNASPLKTFIDHADAKMLHLRTDYTLIP
jgi:hypothetical protein